MDLCNLLNIPFITGFCFWQDVINLNVSYKNIDILNSDNIKKSKNFNIVNNDSFIYSSSVFMQQVIKKYHNIDTNIIETISISNNYKISKHSLKFKYITIVNINYYKGGWLLNKILELDFPFLLIDTEHNKDEFNKKLQVIINNRKNKKFKHEVKWIKEKMDITKIYSKTKILLIPSIVDETFCKIAYEGMKNNIPILSSMNGNLKYLLDGYADFLNENSDEWKNKLNAIYNNDDYLNEMKKRKEKNYIDEKQVFNNFNSLVNKVSLYPKKYNLLSKNVGLLIPWADQGLGIQAREYYIQLEKKGYTVHIMSFKPYTSSKENKYCQTDKSEWNYKNIYYYENTREKITLEDIMHFIKNTKISSMIFIELCYDKIFEIAEIFKLFGINIIGIPNIETTRYTEIHKHSIFSKILCNNIETLNILKNFNIDCDYLGFNINHPFMTLKQEPILKNKINFFCIGGLNAIKRKHIDKICEIFNILKNDNIVLNVYIQGVDYITKNYNNVNIYTKNCNYKEISEIYKNNDIFIHFGGQEGLGLGFYESLKCGTPIITLDAPPNNEIIINNHTGWLIKTTKKKIKYNSESIIMEDVFDKDDFIKTIKNISKSYDPSFFYNNIKNIQYDDYILNLTKYLI
jgi:glycosyltransferase involved in cell wall biosynthesis